MNTTWNINWRRLVGAGLLAGIIVLYMAAVGMLVAFNGRQVIREVVTLGQILMFAPTIGVAYVTARKIDDRANIFRLLVSGVVIGAVSTVPLILLLLVMDRANLRDIFVSLNRTVIEILTFERDSLREGGLVLLASLTAAGVFGAGLVLIPTRLRRAMFVGIGVVLVTGVMSELVVIILRQGLERSTINRFFQRDLLLRDTAIGLFVISAGISLAWPFFGRNARQRAQALPAKQQEILRGSGLTVLGLVLLALPWVLGTFLSEVMSNVGLFVLMGLGLNIAVGLAGLLDLGYVTNFAVGAYVMGVLTSTGPLGVDNKAGIEFFNFWLALPISVLAAMTTGFLLALPVLRMRGDYLAIATLGFGEIIRLLALSDWLRPVVGGAQGILFIPKPVFLGINISGPQQIYYVILAGCLLTVYVSVRLNNSRTGRQWMSIREDEDAASAMGIDTSRAKLLAFTLSAASGGLAGGIFAMKLGTIFPHSFNLLISINVLSLIIVGGMGSIPGVVVGAIVLVGMPELLREFAEYRLLLYGALLVVMMRSRPEGLWPSAVRQREIEQAQEEASVVLAPGD